jgi:FkbM family methyltransferase
MKNKIKHVLQNLLGFDTYLFVFSIFTILKLKWDKKEKDFIHFLKLIPDNGNILDIGANIGIMTVHLGRQFTQSTVFSFEPVPNNIKALKKIIKFFKVKNVTIFEYALGDTNGNIEMVMPIIKSVKEQGLSHVVHETITEFNEGQKYSVPIYMLDSIAEINNNKPVTGIKLDVENFEYYVLKGAENTLLKYKPVIYCELWDNDNRYRTFDFVTSLGYSIKVLINNNLVDYNKEKHNKQYFFFIHNSK